MVCIKKNLVLLLVLMLSFALTGCGNEEASNVKREKDEALILGKNAFGVSFSVRKVSKEPVTFIVEPFADKFGDGTNAFEVGEGTGIWGKDALVAGKKQGNKASLDGSFTIYANGKDGSSVTVKVKGVYKIDEDGYCETDDHMFYYLYDGGQFIESNRETVLSP